MKFNIRLLYLYLFSFIGLLVSIIGMVQLTDLFIKVYVFKGADEYTYSIPAKTQFNPGNPDNQTQSQEEVEAQNRAQKLETTRQRQRQASSALAMVIIGIPLYLYHWKKIQKGA